MGFNPLNAELNPICHFLALLGAHPILHVSGVRVNSAFKGLMRRHFRFVHRTYRVLRHGKCCHNVTREAFMISGGSRNISVECQCPCKGKVTPLQGRLWPRGGRGIALLFQDLGARRGLGVSVTPRPKFTPRKDPVPIVQEVGWASGPVWTGAENLASTVIRSPDHPARSQSLYRLSYPAHQMICDAV
jgi:hypothetical protein